MNYKNCKHYKDVVWVLDNNLSLEDVNFEIDDTSGCECKSDEESICALWINLALAHDFIPQMTPQNVAQTLANLDAKMTEIAFGFLNHSIESKYSDEPESIDEPIMDSVFYESFNLEQKHNLEQLIEMDNTTNNNKDSLPIKIKAYRGNSNKQSVVSAFSRMDTKMLRQFFSDQYKYSSLYNKDQLVDILEEEVFENFKKNGDTYLIPYEGSCEGNCFKNLNCKGITFVGNFSKDVINIIFEEARFEYIDVFSCSNFEILENIETRNCYNIPTALMGSDDIPF